MTHTAAEGVRRDGARVPGRRGLAGCAALRAVAVFLLGATVAAQPGRPLGTPTAEAPPALKAGARVYAIQGARIVTLAGAPIDRGTIIIDNGKIAAVGANVPVPAGAEIVKADGLQVSPGFFDSVSELGLTEVGSVGATNDITELGAFNPQLVAATAVHPPSEHIPVARANGITHAIAAPAVGPASVIMGGQASAIHLNGWTVEEMSIEKAVAITVNWPSLAGPRSFDVAAPSRRSRPFSDVKAEYDRRVRELADWIERARRYAQAQPGAGDRDLKLEALVPVVRGELPLLIYANDARDIRNAVAFCDTQKLRLILAGAADASLVTDLLAARKVPVILGPVHSLPSGEDDPYDIRNTTPGVLFKAGVPFALASFGSADSRNVPHEIANAVSYGLPYDEALKAVTLAPAQIFGLGARLGSLEPGKIANLIVTTGDPLEYTSQVRYVFINGQPVSLDNKHRRSYDKWRARPRPAGAAATPTASR